LGKAGALAVAAALTLALAAIAAAIAAIAANSPLTSVGHLQRCSMS